MLVATSLMLCVVCLITKGKLLLTKDVSDIGDDLVTSVILFAPSTILITLWTLGLGDSNTYLHQVDVFLQAFFVMKVILHLRHCGMWQQCARALRSYSLLFINICYC